MVDLNINAHRQQQTGGVSHGETIVIKKGGHRASITDRIEQLDGKQVDIKIPPADYPELGAPNYGARNAAPPQKNASPAATFQNAFDNVLGQADLTGQDLGGLSPDEAKNMMAYALNHPGVKLDPNVTKLLNKFINQATQMTRDKTGNDNWTFQPPKASSADASKNFSDNFLAALASQSDLSPEESGALTYAHYNPWASGALNKDLQGKYNQLTAQAETETRGDLNLGPDEALNSDSQGFETTMNQAYEDAFRDLTKGIKDKQVRGAVMTLFYHPEAEVQNKAMAEQFLDQFKNLAGQKTAKEFNLPPGVTLKPEGGAAYDQMIKDTLQKTFDDFSQRDGVKFSGVSKDLVKKYGDEIKALGLGPHTDLQPPELQQAYDLVRNAAIGKMKLDFGLPIDWSPENDDLGKVADETDEGEFKTGESEGTSETDEAWSGAVSNDDIVNRVKYGIPNIGLDDDSMLRDYNSAINFLNYTQNQVQGVTKFANNFLVGADKISILDAMAAVSIGLSTLRETAYLCQIRETQAAKAIARMQQAIQQDKTRADEIQRKRAEDKAKKKPFFLFKILQKIVPSISKLVINLCKFALWAVDTLAGGLVSMITQAAGCEPITKNPLLAMGLIDKAQAAKMDMALQIIAMVVEMLVSVIMANPGMLMAIMARMIEMVASTAAKVAVNVAVQVGKSVATEAIAKVGLEVAKTVGKEAIEETVEATIKVELRAALKESLETSGKMAGKGGTDAAKAVESVAEKWIETEAKKLAKAVVKQSLEEASDDAAKAAVNAGSRAGATVAERAAGEAAQKTLEENMKVLGKIAREMEDQYKESVRALVKAARKSAGQAMIGNVLPNIMLANDIIQGLGQVAGHAAQVPQNLKQAHRVKELAKVKAFAAEMSAYLEANKKSSSVLLDSVGELGKWVDQINRQQAQYWQKAQIHFIVA